MSDLSWGCGSVGRGLAWSAGNLGCDSLLESGYAGRGDTQATILALQ